MKSDSEMLLAHIGLKYENLKRELALFMDKLKCNKKSLTQAKRTITSLECLKKDFEFYLDSRGKE